jgi:Protein of unknown function (DUF2637)
MIEALAALTIAGLALVAELAIRRAVAAMKRWTLPTLPKRAPRPPREPKTPVARGGQAMAYLLLVGGTLTTVAANYAHAEENVGAKALSAVIPVLLFFAFHMAARDGRWLIRAGTGAVALFCFAISYDHISGLAKDYGESDGSAVLYPLAIDGAMIVATFVLSRTSDRTASESVRETIRVPARPAPPRTAVAHALSSDPKPVLSAPVEDRTVLSPVRPKRSPEDNEARLSAAREIADDLGDNLSRAKLVERLNKQGYTISTGAAAALVRELKAARPSR